MFSKWVLQVILCIFPLPNDIVSDDHLKIVCHTSRKVWNQACRYRYTIHRCICVSIYKYIYVHGWIRICRITLKYIYIMNHINVLSKITILNFTLGTNVWCVRLPRCGRKHLQWQRLGDLSSLVRFGLRVWSVSRIFIRVKGIYNMNNMYIALWYMVLHTCVCSTHMCFADIYVYMYITYHVQKYLNCIFRDVWHL